MKKNKLKTFKLNFKNKSKVINIVCFFKIKYYFKMLLKMRLKMQKKISRYLYKMVRILVCIDESNDSRIAVKYIFVFCFFKKKNYF